ncbi:MAG: hypothetical protein AB7G75_12660 [Candidatus Binatia bacterium]
MKATAIGLIVLSVYWILQGIGEIRQNDMNGAVTLILGIVLLPVAKYVWGRDIGNLGSSKPR